MIDATWINALKLPTKVLSGVFIACLIILGLDGAGIVPLSDFGKLWKAAIIMMLSISGALTFTSAIAYFIDKVDARNKRSLFLQRREMKKAEEEATLASIKCRALARVEHLSKEELRLLADCLRDNRQSFTTYIHNPHTSTLISKGLIYTPGGTHHQDYYPFIVQDFVWQYLRDNRESILDKDRQNQKAEEKKKKNESSRRY